MKLQYCIKNKLVVNAVNCFYFILLVFIRIPLLSKNLVIFQDHFSSFINKHYVCKQKGPLRWHHQQPLKLNKTAWLCPHNFKLKFFTVRTHWGWSCCLEVDKITKSWGTFVHLGSLLRFRVRGPSITLVE